MEIVKKKLGTEAFVLAWTNGPLNVASQVLRLDEVLIAMAERTGKAPPAPSNAASRFPSSTPGPSSPPARMPWPSGTPSPRPRSSRGDYYETFAFPYEKRLVAAVHEAGAKVFTHICGRIEPIADLIARTGTDVIDFDHMCDIEILLGTIPERSSAGTSTRNSSSSGPKREIRKTVENLLAKAAASGRLLLGSGCEIALNTPPEQSSRLRESRKGLRGFS